MSAVLVSKEKNRAIFTVEIENEAFLKSIEEVYKKNRQYFSIPGFRRGKAPRKIIELNYGKEVFYEDAINNIIPQSYEEAINELDLHPVDQPDVNVDEIKDGEKIKVTFEVDIMPIGELGDYSNLEATIHEYKVNEEDVERALQKQQEENARMVGIDDRAVQEGDICTIDFKGYKDDKPFEGGEAENYDLTIGSKTFIPGFEEKIIGHQVGDEFDVDVTFPENYHEKSLAGKPVVFKVKLNKIQEKQLPEADDEFVKDISEFDTLEDYKNDLRKKMQEDFDKREKIEKENKAVEALVNVFSIDIPESMITREAEHEFKKMGYQIRNMGLSMEQYLQMFGKTEEDMKQELRPRAKQNILSDFALEEYIKKENIESSEDEVMALIDDMSASYPEDQREHMKEHMLEDKKAFENESNRRKAIDKLVNAVKFSVCDNSEDEIVENQDEE